MKKMLPWLVSLLLAITLIAIVVMMIWPKIIGDDSKTPDQIAKESVDNVQAESISADELVKITSELSDIKTNLADPEYVVIMGFAFQLDSVKAKNEFDKIKTLKIKSIVNSALWNLTPDEMSSKSGKDKLKADLINSINLVLSEGKVNNVDITSFIMTTL
ncbi:MAG: flagellar basal body-associated FliL family protein [Candidatus Cohnella colombiensis]|uniref:Flagellar protein FliL n=1 Tax=Candidatus Cohnella colombiensis TaxID=3121368 RepID=A0AA95JEK2_9BACL|nr:MAG: flagellar basal body-associated FliL family protein [Cohnella sp.]